MSSALIKNLPRSIQTKLFNDLFYFPLIFNNSYLEEYFEYLQNIDIQSQTVELPGKALNWWEVL